MPHVDLPPLPGIAGLLAGHPLTAGPLNSYVDGLGTLTPDDPADYERHAGFLAAKGYLRPPR